MLVFVFIGAWSVTRAEASTDDYLVASRNINPWLTGLSAVATQNSGFMYIGMIGLTYTTGISSMWVLLGSMCGSYMAWLFVFKAFRLKSVSTNTIMGFLANGNRSVALTGGLVTFIFLSVYAAAQLTAGSKTLHVLLGWETWLGAVLGAIIIVIYCFAGGIRASIWTDAAQSMVTLIAMTLLMSVSVIEAGGFILLWEKLGNIDPVLIELLPQGLEYGFALFLFGWMVTGFGMIGQPHIMVRVQAIRSVDDIAVARRVYLAWFILFATVSVGVGLACRVLLPEFPSFDTELALPRLSLQLLPPVLVGLMLAGMFAATMSTADSQVLACSAAITQDINPRWSQSYTMVKLATIGVTILALTIALFAIETGNDSVFLLVVIAWGALTGALGPLMLLRIAGVAVGPKTSIMMITTGLVVVIFWRYGLQLSYSIFDALPGMASGLLVYSIVRVISRTKMKEHNRVITERQ